MSIIGFHRDGGFAESVLVPAWSLIPVPTALPGALACFAEPLGCALNALEQLRLLPGMTLLIYGGGTFGLLLGMAARSRGVEPFLVETNSAKLDRSKEFRAVFEISGSLACDRTEYDAVINAAVSSSTFLEGISKLRSGGVFCLFSGLTSRDLIPSSLINEVHYRQLHVVGAYGCTRDNMEKALVLLQHHPEDIEWLVQDKIRLEQVPDVLPAVLCGEVLRFIIEL
jgi:threonine dehydrogenase-like Zn-dependent dehydrogenase